LLQDSLFQSRFGSILEYLPYRKSEWSANRDHLRHSWMASHGFVVVRADLRGAGDSQGLLHDEYAPTEQDDACQIIGA
jgi:predicted acyl esterase